MLIWQSNSRGISMRKARNRTLVGAGLAVALIGLSAVPFQPIIVYNPSPSAPVGYYLTRPPAPLKRGDWVLLQPPASVRTFADGRGYLPATVPMIKTVSALAGDRICALDGVIFVNGQYKTVRLRRDRIGRALPAWAGCHTLTAGEVFVLNADVRDSFDGRYFGVVSREAVRARLIKL